MSARSFFDTNVLLYTDSSDAPAKRKRALELLGEHRLARTGVVSLQVLQEWDALIVRAAKQGGCSVVHSEDLQHGHTIDGVRIVNPFR